MRKKEKKQKKVMHRGGEKPPKSPNQTPPKKGLEDRLLHVKVEKKDEKK